MVPAAASYIDLVAMMVIVVMLLDPITPPVEPLFDPIALGIEPFFDPIALGIEPFRPPVMPVRGFDLGLAI